jgi:hypothetical protein
VRHDVTTLRGRRADRRWNRMAVGDIFERVTWSAPNKTASQRPEWSPCR